MPDVIHLLSDHIANQIAAGEVIQRPASAVKEMLENAVDAGATDIQLIIKDAGKELVQVVDNGSGMSPTDARMSFERHATSKIKDINDLFSIRTMGFRGEALASIAAVAQVELKSMKKRCGSRYTHRGRRYGSESTGTLRYPARHQPEREEPFLQRARPQAFFKEQYYRVQAYY